jgi:hypothetical protein
VRDFVLLRKAQAAESVVLLSLLRLAARNMERNVSRQWQRQADAERAERERGNSA